MNYTGPVPCSISDTQKTKANEVWNLIDADQGGVEYQDFDAFLTANGLKRVAEAKQ